jgi:mersacidin/lichenicidin family type 2 lantibiotic
MKGNTTMSHEQIIRAWKDSNYRSSLSQEELALLPTNPAGVVLTESELESVVGQIALSSSPVNNYSFYTNGATLVGNSGFNLNFTQNQTFNF